MRGGGLASAPWLLAACLFGRYAAAQDASAPTESAQPGDATARGRSAYQRGITLAHDEHWSDALSAFEEAAAARDAPLIRFNIAYCERALGRYVAARNGLRRVLADPTGLDATQIDDAKAYLAETERLVVRVAVRLEPAAASLAVDGRSLVPDEGDAGAYLALGRGGDGDPMNRADFVVVLDPGAHLFRATRTGHEHALVNRSYRDGDSAALDLRLDLLPATVALRSDPAQSIVTLDGRELGVSPLDFQRAAGSYKLEVERRGFETYRATLDLQPGQHVDLTAKLNPYTEPLTKKWWFWGGTAVVVAGGALLTYALTRPAAQPPPYDPGNTGLLLHTQGARW
jgi:tetratricopeptide (TPR) repeat protein